MKIIALYIRNTKLKMNVIRILMKNDFYYIEASTTEELFIKLDLCNNVGLLIMDFDKGQYKNDFSTLVQANLQQIPTLLMIPDEYSFILPKDIKKHITDIILTPFNSNTLIRKINAIIHIQKNRAKLREEAVSETKIFVNQDEKIILALESAVRGGYSICIIRIFVPGAFMELNLQLLEKLQHIMSQSDQVIETDLGEFIILCPHTPLESLQAVKNKIHDAIYPIVKAERPNTDIEISGFNFPEEIKTYNEVISMLTNKIS